MGIPCPRKSPGAKSPKAERVKQPRVWALGGDSRDVRSLDFSDDKDADRGDLDISPDTHVILLLCFRLRRIKLCYFDDNS